MSKSIDKRQVNHDRAVMAAPTLANILVDASATINHVVVNVGEKLGEYKQGGKDHRALPSKVAGPANHDSEETKTQFTVWVAANTLIGDLFDVMANALCIMEHGKSNPNGTYSGKPGNGYKSELAAIKTSLEMWRKEIEECGMNQLKLVATPKKEKTPFIKTIAYAYGDDVQRIKVEHVTMPARDDKGVLQYNSDGSVKYVIAQSVTLGSKTFKVNLEDATRAVNEITVKNAIQEIKTEAKDGVAGVKEEAKQKAEEIKQDAQDKIKAVKLASVG